MMVDATLSAVDARPSGRIKPMAASGSALYLAAISLLGIACFYGLRPYLEHRGWHSYPAYLISLSFVFVVMLAWSLLDFLREGHPWTVAAFLQRTGMLRPSARVLAWSLGLGLLMLSSTLVFSPLISRAVASGWLPIPAGIPDYLHPLKQLSVAQIGTQLVAQGVVPLIPVALLLNILAEEIFWRGMVFPRQELAYGSHTFLTHGLVWAFSHLFQYWLLPPILVSSVALAYVYQRTKNTWAGILAHMLNNALPIVIAVLFAA